MTVTRITAFEIFGLPHQKGHRARWVRRVSFKSTEKHVLPHCQGRGVDQIILCTRGGVSNRVEQGLSSAHFSSQKADGWMPLRALSIFAPRIDQLLSAPWSMRDWHLGGDRHSRCVRIRVPRVRSWGGPEMWS